MTITELYNQLENKDFQDHETGNLFFFPPICTHMMRKRNMKLIVKY